MAYGRALTISWIRTLTWFLTLLVCVQVTIAKAQSCKSDRIIEFSGKLCLRGNCTIIHHKAQFIGNKILLYPNPTKNEGTVFEIGQTRDLADVNIAWRPSGPPGSTTHATAQATQNDDIVFLTLDQKWSQGEIVIGEYSQLIGIKTVNCTSCDIVSYELKFDMPGGQGVKASFDKYWCLVPR